jgi:predicted TPR repeat methyltransferase
MKLLLLMFAAGLLWAATAQPTGVERDRLLLRQSRLAAAVRSAPKDIESWRKLGFVYQALGEAEAARDAFAEVVALSPEDAAGWYMLALAHEKLGEKSKATAAWRKCLQYATGGEMIRTAKKHLAFLGGA